MRWILSLFIGIPILELAVLMKVGEWIGFWRTVVVIIVTAVVGASMWKSQGLRILWRLQDEIGKQELPANSLVEGMMILVGGAFLLTPGFVTDAAGFICLIPFTRRFFRDHLKQWIQRKIERGEIEVYTETEGEFDEDP
ncbi:MAG: FxsA family protein [bacterium]